MTTAKHDLFRDIAIGIGSMLVLAGAPAFAMEQGAMDHGAMDHAHMEKTAAAAMTDGEIRKIDAEQGQLTIKHGDIKNLGMPGMTMVFTAEDKMLLSGVKIGDKVKFTAARENGKLMVTTIEVVPAK